MNRSYCTRLIMCVRCDVNFSGMHSRNDSVFVYRGNILIAATPCQIRIGVVLGQDLISQLQLICFIQCRFRIGKHNRFRPYNLRQD